MPGTRFAQGMNIKLNGRDFIIEKRLPDGMVQIRDSVLNTYSAVKEIFLVQSIFSGNLEIFNSYNDLKERRQHYISADFTSLPEDLRECAKRKYRYVSNYIKSSIEGRSRKQIELSITQTAEEIYDDKPPSVSTFYRWLKEYEASGMDIRVLVPSNKSKGNRTPRIPLESRKIIENVINEYYLTPQRPTGKAAFEVVVARIENQNRFRQEGDKIPMPDKATIYRAIKEIDPYDRALGHYGKKMADKMFMAAKHGPRPKRPLERVEVDHTKLDLFVIDTVNKLPIGRPYLTSMIDVCTKMILGFYIDFEPPSYLSVMQCMRHAIAPKGYVKSRFPSVCNEWRAYGIPEVMVVDNGKEFHSTHMEDACLQLGIAVQYAPPQTPWYKGSVERHFGTINKQLLHLQPGTTFSNLVEKSEYDPKKNAVIPLNTLIEIVHIWVIDVYQQTYHRGIKSTPSKVWKMGIAEFPPALPPTKKDWDVLLGTVVKRTLSGSGVEYLGLLYNSMELAKLRRKSKKGERFTVKVDPIDISCIYVLDEDTGEFVCVPANDQEYTKGLSLWQHNVVRRLARQEADQVDIVALALAKDKIQQIVAREWNSVKNKSSRMTMARWLGIGSKAFNSLCSENSQTDAEVYNVGFSQGEGTDCFYNGGGSLRAILDIGNSPSLKGGPIAVADELEEVIGQEQVCPSETSQGVEPETTEDQVLDLTGWDADYRL